MLRKVFHAVAIVVVLFTNCTTIVLKSACCRTESTVSTCTERLPEGLPQYNKCLLGIWGHTSEIKVCLWRRGSEKGVHCTSTTMNIRDMGPFENTVVTTVNIGFYISAPPTLNNSSCLRLFPFVWFTSSNWVLIIMRRMLQKCIFYSEDLCHCHTKSRIYGAWPPILLLEWQREKS